MSVGRGDKGYGFECGFGFRTVSVTEEIRGCGTGEAELEGGLEIWVRSGVDESCKAGEGTG